MVAVSNVWADRARVWIQIIGPGFIGFQEVSADAISEAATAVESLSQQDRIEIFERVWKTVNDKYYDSSFNGIDWNAVGEAGSRPLWQNCGRDETQTAGNGCHAMSRKVKLFDFDRGCTRFKINYLGFTTSLDWAA